MSAKKAKKLLENEPVSAAFHPKDTQAGMLFRVSGFGSTVSHRGTVLISVGGATAECTTDAAQKFADQLACTINCAKNAK